MKRPNAFGRIALAWLALVVLLTTPGAARAQLFQKTDPQHEIDLGRRVAKEVERTEPLSKEKAVQDRVRRVGAALVERLEPKVYPYEFKALASSEVNAFCLPGGFIYIYEGLLGLMPDDNELAFVLAHEMAHASNRHWAQQTNKLKKVGVLGILASVAVGDTGGYIASLATSLMGMHYSREQESEADAAALDYMWKAGYNTKGAAEAMQIIVGLEKGRSTPKYLRSHPPAKDRLNKLQTKSEALKTQTRPADSTSTSSAVDVAIDVSTVVGDISAYQVASNDWFPMAVGNEWTYQVQGKDASSYTVYTVRIVSAIQAGGGYVYRAETSFGKKTSVYYQLLSTSDQVWRRNRLTSADSKWQIEQVTNAPAEQPLELDKWRYSLVGTEEISVPCGAFSARKIKKQGGEPANTFDIWFVQGVGLAKRVCEETGVTETLTAYKVNPTPVKQEVPAPEAAKPEAAKAETAAPEAAKQETVVPEAPKQETPATEPPKQETAAPAPAATGTESPAQP
ncbi:MAG: M48 family metalloprotease [Armatimonadota bacterium]|nr:M48 family metalloprotease [Armatimonadota bacterium]